MLEQLISTHLKCYFGEIYVVGKFGLGITIILILALSIILYYLVKLIVVKLIDNLLAKTKSIFWHAVVKNKVLDLLAHLVAGFFVWSASQFITRHTDTISLYSVLIINKVSLGYIFIVMVLMINRLIWSLNSYYEKRFILAKQYPLYSYLKVSIFCVWVISGILIIAYFANTSPWALLTGVGAISAVFLLVFKDTLLGIIASIQATASNIVRIGDRISIDKYGVDGSVLDIAINTVKLKNADNTIATIPTYMLTSEMVKNWRPIEELGVRRIKRALHIDINSIKVCSQELLNRLSQFKVIADFITKQAQGEIINLALYRMYIEDYLCHNNHINPDYLTMVRHLDSGPTGLPLEIYTFTNAVDLVTHEKVQADIFEHCFAALAIFELTILQGTAS